MLEKYYMDDQIRELERAKIDGVLDDLWAALKESGLEDIAARVKRAKGLPLREVLDVLSLSEREVTDVDAHKAIAMFKQVLTGKRAYDDADLTMLLGHIHGTI